jgi:hypothetical protein
MEEVIKKVNGVEVRISNPGANNTTILLLIKDGPSMYLPKATREIENYLEDARMLIDIMSSGKEHIDICGCGCNPLGVTILTDIMWLLLHVGRYNGDGNNGTVDAFVQAYNSVLSLYWEQ